MLDCFLCYASHFGPFHLEIHFPFARGLEMEVLVGAQMLTACANAGPGQQRDALSLRCPVPCVLQPSLRLSHDGWAQAGLQPQSLHPKPSSSRIADRHHNTLCWVPPAPRMTLGMQGTGRRPLGCHLAAELSIFSVCSLFPSTTPTLMQTPLFGLFP